MGKKMEIRLSNTQLPAGITSQALREVFDRIVADNPSIDPSEAARQAISALAVSFEGENSIDVSQPKRFEASRLGSLGLRSLETEWFESNG